MNRFCIVFMMTTVYVFHLPENANYTCDGSVKLCDDIVMSDQLGKRFGLVMLLNARFRLVFGNGENATMRNVVRAVPIEMYNAMQTPIRSMSLMETIDAIASCSAYSDRYNSFYDHVNKKLGYVRDKARCCARLIWRSWFRAITCPDYMLCRMRLLREFDEYLAV